MKNSYIICLGMFDGVHIGHQALIKQAASIACDCRIAAFTFTNHPSELFGQNTPCLCTLSQRERYLKDCGADEVISVPFDTKFASLSPEAFVKGLLSQWNIRTIVVGYNYTFGAGGCGNSETLLQLGDSLGFDVSIVPPVMYAEEPVSSSRIRACLSRGDLGQAEDMLGRPYTLAGKVVGNRQIGRRIGFPTANIDTGNQLLPPDGVYASRFRTATDTFDAVTNIGMNPTVGGTIRTVETHLIGVQLDLYGIDAEVSLHAFLRGEKKFSGEESLKKQIALDVTRTVSVLKDL